MDRLPNVYTGFWRDYERGGLNAFHLTVSDKVNQAIQLTIGVLFGIAAPFLSQILRRCGSWIRYLWQLAQGDATGEREYLLGSRPQQSLYPQDKTAADQQTKRDRITLLLAVFIWILVSVGWALAGGFASSMSPSDSVGLSASTTCAPYSLKKDAHDNERVADDMLQGQKEIRAGEYGFDCYDPSSLTDFNRCGFFSNQSIQYHKEFVRCPFANDTYCVGTYQAVNFFTDMIDSAVIGLHASQRPKFRRNTTCVPLSMDAGFKDGPYMQNGQLQVDYYLGPMNRTDEFTKYTFRQYGDPFKWGVATYSVNVYESTPYPDIDYWEPLPDLERKNGTWLSILFIASCRVKYTGPSEDYIFPAPARFKKGPYFYNDVPVSRPLACIDSSEICSSDGNCSRIDQEHEGHDKAYEFVRAALRKSTTYQSIQTRLGNGLRATRSIRDSVSYQLDNRQWVIESEQLFRTSLARIQFDALDIAIGLGSGKPSHHIDSSDWVVQDTLCGLYKFKLPKGYTDVNPASVVGILAVIAFVAGLSLQTDLKFDEKRQRHFPGGRMLVFECIVWVLGGAWMSLTKFSLSPLKVRWTAWNSRKHQTRSRNTSTGDPAPAPAPAPLLASSSNAASASTSVAELASTIATENSAPAFDSPSTNWASANTTEANAAVVTASAANPAASLTPTFDSPSRKSASVNTPEADAVEVTANAANPAASGAPAFDSQSRKSASVNTPEAKPVIVTIGSANPAATGAPTFDSPSTNLASTNTTEADTSSSNTGPTKPAPATTTPTSRPAPNVPSSASASVERRMSNVGPGSTPPEQSVAAAI